MYLFIKPHYIAYYDVAHGKLQLFFICMWEKEKKVCEQLNNFIKYCKKN
jgi:hypothetical protein